jgi:diguanylate cyclase (GGDEF)-like protein
MAILAFVVAVTGPWRIAEPASRRLGSRVIPGAPEAVRRLRDQGLTVRFCANTDSKPLRVGAADRDGKVSGAVEGGVVAAVGVVLQLLGCPSRGRRSAAASWPGPPATPRPLKLTRVDELTGLPNRRGWSAELPAAIERARRDRVELSIAMLDLDHFKRFNDEYGHQAGDRLLKGATAAWSSQLRAVDQLGRYGGEEFIVLLPGATAELATGVLERLRASTPAGQTFSAGVATWDGTETSEDLIARADQALYHAKAAGRDRILVATMRARTATQLDGTQRTAEAGT